VIQIERKEILIRMSKVFYMLLDLLLTSKMHTHFPFPLWERLRERGKHHIRNNSDCAGLFLSKICLLQINYPNFLFSDR
jgi:hypothetical protein